MTRQRVPALLLGTGVGLATACASVADFVGVIHGYCYGTGAAGLPRTGAEGCQYPRPGRCRRLPELTAPGRPGRRRIAAGLASLFVRRGDTVALMMTNRPEFYLADTAAFHLTRQWSARPLRMADPPSAGSSSRCTRWAERRVRSWR
jgi:hypothetical protein